MHGRMARFLVVGGGCALLYFALAWVLQARGGFPPFLATAAAYLISFGIAYALQRAWTFESNASHTVTLPRYAAVQALAALLTAASTQALAHYYPSSSNMVIAAVSTVLAGSISFVLSSTWVFSHVSKPSQ
ncbi:GtrA family protein [Rhodanobacter ginsengisoli]|uniref:GtrA family protein n=1 Tax=Rhodanobacter ginsengisoli TaxID=418646 RepID=A0ABW0QTW7_9GAMM